MGKPKRGHIVPRKHRKGDLFDKWGRGATASNKTEILKRREFKRNPLEEENEEG